MVDLTFGARAKHLVPLSLLRLIADAPGTAPPAGLEYLGEDGVAAIKGASHAPWSSAVPDSLQQAWTSSRAGA